MKKLTTILAVLAMSNFAFSQEQTQKEESTETQFSNPLYLDIPTEFNVKKGYKELNVLGAFQNFDEFKYYRTAVEYAFSPIDNLGLEVETPFNLYSSPENAENKLEAIRIGGMYSLPNLKIQDFALSVGFYNDFEFSTFQHFGKPLFEGNAFHPFIGIAKVWDKKFTTLVFAGPNFRTNFEENHTLTDFHINTTLGYKIGEKNNFVNLETNSVVYKGDWSTYLRPQVRLSLKEQWSLGLGATIPTKSEQKGFGGFFRLIYNP